MTQARDAVLDVMFLAGTGLYGWGLWRVAPDWAPLIGGVTLMGLVLAAHAGRKMGRLNAS